MRDVALIVVLLVAWTVLGLAFGMLIGPRLARRSGEVDRMSEDWLRRHREGR